MKKKVLLACKILEMTKEELVKLKAQNGRRRKKNQNPPVVIISDGLGMHVCKVCPNATAKKDQKYTNNMVFRKKGVTGYHNKVLNKCTEQQGSNLHFHLNTECLRKHDQTFEVCNVYMNDEVWQSLLHEQMMVLKEVGILKPIAVAKVCGKLPSSVQKWHMHLENLCMLLMHTNIFRMLNLFHTKLGLVNNFNLHLVTSPPSG